MWTKVSQIKFFLEWHKSNGNSEKMFWTSFKFIFCHFNLLRVNIYEAFECVSFFFVLIFTQRFNDPSTRRHKIKNVYQCKGFFSPLKPIRCNLTHVSISHVFYWCSIIHFRFIVGACYVSKNTTTYNKITCTIYACKIHEAHHEQHCSENWNRSKRIYKLPCTQIKRMHCVCVCVFVHVACVVVIDQYKMNQQQQHTKNRLPSN